MLTRFVIVTLIVFATLTTTVLAKEAAPIKKVFAEKGNIYYCPSGKQRIQLTSSGKDSYPALSPDGKKVAFIRKSTAKAYLSVGAEEDYAPEELFADQVWVVDSNGKNEKMLAKDYYPNESSGADVTKELEKTIAHIDDSMCFSPDSRTVYFVSSAWVTTGGLHSVNIDGSNEHFIDGANTLEKVIDKGDYKGDIIISQHRYYVGGGSYDWYYVFTPEGKEVGPLGDDLDKVNWDILYFESKK